MIKSKLVLVLLMLATAACANADLMGLWEFGDTGNLTGATVGNDLGLVGTHTAITGVDAGDGAVSIGVGSHYRCTAGIPANGGGGWVNEFTLLFDIQYPASSAGSWRAFFNTNNTNSNDSDYFIHPSDDSWGVSAIGYTDNATVGEFYSSSDTWYRAVMSVDLGGVSPFLKLYIDGTLVATHTSGMDLDGRMSLYTAPAVTLILLGDENGEDAEMYCSTLAIWDTPLDADAVAALGIAGTPVDNSAFAKITESSGNTVVTEGGESDSYEVALNTQPSETVLITATPGDGQIDIGNGPGESLVLDFTAENWQTPQTVTVAAFNDDIYEGKNAHKTTITHTADGGEYAGIRISSVEVSVIDDELTCGDWGYFATDLNRDCFVDLRDFVIFAMEWLKTQD